MELTDGELRAVEAMFREALRSGAPSALRILGYGEISTVVAVESPAGQFALKRLPPFDDAARFEAYRDLFEEYLAELRGAGLEVALSRLMTVPSPGGGLVAYCVQPVLPAAALGPRRLAAATEDEAAKLAEAIFDGIHAVVRPHRGFDGQLSNWARVGDEWLYLDVTTPLLRDAGGRDRLDTGLFLASLPAPLRWPVRRFLLRSITDTYFDARQVAVDFLGNLLKEGLARHLPALVEVANRRLVPAITEREVRSYYAGDARTWTALLAVRRLDRFWQLKVRRRPYPFLLPGKIDR